jgi:Protein of unknown function (DUF2889)
VHEIDSYTDSAPYTRCPEAGQSLQALVGLRMAEGWTRDVRQRLAGARGCTHLREILSPLATAAYQALGLIYAKAPDLLKDNGEPRKIDSCYAYAAEGELVLKRWPRFHRPFPPQE